MNPVSYTHLHVIEKKKSPAVCINDSQKVEAVSYTHLDVYKRQV